MKKMLPVVIAILIAFLVTPLVFLIYAPGILHVTDSGWEMFLVGLFLTPVVVAFIGALVVSMHPRSYRFNPIEPMQNEDDPIRHTATGFAQAVLQDFSRGVIAVPQMYSPQLAGEMEEELMMVRQYAQQKFRLQFAFHHTEQYEAHVLHVLNRNEFVVEIDGLFDYFFEKDGQLYNSPHQNVGAEPLIRVPALVRLRIVRDPETTHWQLSGFSENITGRQIGMATR